MQRFWLNRVAENAVVVLIPLTKMEKIVKCTLFLVLRGRLGWGEEHKYSLLLWGVVGYIQGEMASGQKYRFVNR